MSRIISARRLTSCVGKMKPFLLSVMMLALSCQSLATTGRPAANAEIILDIYKCQDRLVPMKLNCIQSAQAFLPPMVIRTIAEEIA